MKFKFNRRAVEIIIILIALCLGLFLFEAYMPKKPGDTEKFVFVANKGEGDEEIAAKLEKEGIIRNKYFFRLYNIIFGIDSELKAGKYSLSPSMSASEIARKMVVGDVIKEKITILEGWDIYDVADYLESKGVAAKKDFLDLTQRDFSSEFYYLKEVPKNNGLEGYIFPDTYEISLGEDAEDLLKTMLSNFDRKITPEMRAEIKKQNKSIFDIIIMASIIEKEVRKLEDKKIVSGILWKRIAIDMPLQVDSTINYITGKSDAGVAIKDTKIDSPYNTYKYLGLPIGPISNPGIESILAAIYPTESQYLYYLSANHNGQTIFSKTLEEHNIARAKYLR